MSVRVILRSCYNILAIHRMIKETDEDHFEEMRFLEQNRTLKVYAIKSAVFQGAMQSEFKDRKEFSGSLFQQMYSVLTDGIIWKPQSERFV